MTNSLTRRQALFQAAAPALGLSSMGLASLSAYAQFRVEVSGIGATQLPIAVPAFRGDDLAPQKVGAIVQADLLRSGVFRTIDGVSGLDETNHPEWSRIRSLGADTLLVGSNNRLADGRFDIRCRLWDAVRGVELGAQNMVVSSTELRYTAHRLADWIYEKLTGEKGVAATRIAYITKTGGSSTPPRFNLWVADSDGEGASSALASSEPIISPAWSPSGQQLAYVSFESRKPVVYVHEVATGRRRVIANFKGSNSSPAWSPDGRNLIVTLSRDGGSQMFLISASGGEPHKLSSSLSIDTEAVFAPDGQNIYFVSDRGGSPQIYRMPLSGGAAQRVSFSSNYSISPAISPNGKQLAFISRIGGAFKLVIQELTSGLVQPLTDTDADESPSFSANGKQIIYATQISSAGRWQEALMTTTLDGRVKSKLTAALGDIREPDWGVFQGSALK